jgi:hypothetical protein
MSVGCTVMLLYTFQALRHAAGQVQGVPSMFVLRGLSVPPPPAFPMAYVSLSPRLPSNGVDIFF